MEKVVKRMSRPLPFALVMILAVTANLHAATYFVRSGASGNGTSWANAWASPGSISWSQLNAGDTVCIAGGTYTAAIKTGKSGIAGKPITIKRALASDGTCGSGTIGWSSSYDAQVVITGIFLQNDYVTIDGGVWNGITMTQKNCASGDCAPIGVGGPTNGVALRYIESAGPCGSTACNGGAGDPRNVDLNYWTGSTYALQQNFLFQYLNLHGACNNMWIANAANGIIEHSRFADSVSTSSCHENVIIAMNSSNMTFRYNEVTNWLVEGILFCPTSACGTISWDIYGNIWHDAATGSYPRFLATQNGTYGPFHIYNNTFVKAGSYACYSNENSGAGLATGSTAYNNLYYGNSFADCGFPMGEDYAYSDESLSETHGQGKASNPFDDYSAKTVAGYNLTLHTNPGLSLGSPYNIDYNGNTRTNWDRGAFEYHGSSAPSPPQGLAAVVQ